MFCFCCNLLKIPSETSLIRIVNEIIEHTISRYRVVDPAYSRGTHVLYVQIMRLLPLLITE